MQFCCLIEDIFDRFNLGIRGVLRGEAGGDTFQMLTQRIEFRDLLAIQLGDHGAALRLECQASFRLEPPKGLAHRCAADVEFLGDVRLANPFSRMVFALANRTFHLAVDELAERRHVSLG